MEQLQGIAEQLDVARKLIAQQRLDIVEALTMLNALPPSIEDERIDRHARFSAIAMGNGQHLIIARYALARVIVLLEDRVAAGECVWDPCVWLTAGTIRWSGNFPENVTRHPVTDCSPGGRETAKKEPRMEEAMIRKSLLLAAAALLTATAPALAKTVKSVGISVGDLGNPFFEVIVRGATDKIREMSGAAIAGAAEHRALLR